MNKVICVGRQYGSGGHDLARKIAEKEGIAFFDKEIFAKAVEESGIEEGEFDSADERRPNPFLSPVFYEGNSMDYYGMNAHDMIFELQSKIIVRCASEGSCVIVGRCAGSVLRGNSDFKVLDIFIASPMEKRISTVMDRDNLSERGAASKIRKIDRARAAYHNYYSGDDWGNPSEYDLCLNSGLMEEEMILDIVDKMYKAL